MPSRGRPKKDPNAPKANYNLSRLELAKRATRKKLTDQRKRANKAAKKVAKYRQNVKNIENSAKKIQAGLNGTDSRIIDESDVDSSINSVRDLVEDQDVIFRPNSGPQEEFLSASEEDVLYGGAAGGGKSFALLIDPLRYCHNGNHRGLLLRRTLDELTELIDKSKQLYPKAFPNAHFRESKSTWVFPSGATMWFTYLDRDKDVTRFQGQAFNWIGIDEITQYPTP